LAKNRIFTNNARFEVFGEIACLQQFALWDGLQSVYSAGMNPTESAFVQDVTCQPDPCLSQEFSILRFAVLALLFVAMFGTALLLILLKDRPYGIQVSTTVGYTAAVALYTFSGNRNNMQPFLLSCPAVRRQLPLLIRRHLGFLAVLFMIQTVALKLRPNLPGRLTTPSQSGPSPFVVILGGLCACLAIAQVLNNRSLLERAHISSQGNAS
jgi:hypothetical protein